MRHREVRFLPKDDQTEPSGWGMKTSVTVQLHHEGAWHDAATVDLAGRVRGVAESSSTAYEIEYYAAWGAESLVDGAPQKGIRALSVGMPLDLVDRRYATWPPFLLDLLPQGHARRRLVDELGLGADNSAAELPLLLRSGGSPIGNIRIKEAWAEETERLRESSFPGVTEEDVRQRTDHFREMAERFALVASGSSGVQGEWPKILLTRSTDGRWYPDPLIADDAASEHVIVKLSREKGRDDELILRSEAPYMEIARAFGLKVGSRLRYTPHVLMIPRFDRSIDAKSGRTIRYGQESIVSAAGVAQFGYMASHEQYIDVIKTHSTNPAEDIIEYLMRDILNLAMGNPDNHGRNTAIRKSPDGRIGITPLFDFAPMRLDPALVVRSTRWRCLKGDQLRPDWALVCEIAADGVMSSGTVAEVLASKESLVRRLPAIARSEGLPEEVIDRAFSNSDAIADSLAELGGFKRAEA